MILMNQIYHSNQGKVMSEEIEVTKGLNFGLDKLDSICQEMAENENYQPTPEEIEAQKKEIRKYEAKEKQKNLEASGIGERYFNASFENYNCNIPERKEVLDKLKLFIQNYQEKTLWMVGNSGTGKTMFAAIICRECLHAHFVKSYEIELELDDCKSFKASESKKELLKRYKDYPVLIIDEIGKFESKDEVKYLFMIINERYENKKCTVLISNKSKIELVEYLGKPIFDRFTENCMSIEFNFDSYRINMRSK